MFEIDRPSPNYTNREPGYKITCLVLHSTEGSTLEGSLSWLTSPASNVSSHIVICKLGGIYRLVQDEKRAYHAGVSTLFGEVDVNGFSLGLELDHAGAGIYSDAQIRAAVEWCAEKAFEYSIPLNRIVGHNMIAPGRKSDPQGFPWKKFLLEVGKLQSLYEL